MCAVRHACGCVVVSGRCKISKSQGRNPTHHTDPCTCLHSCLHVHPPCCSDPCSQNWQGKFCRSPASSIIFIQPLLNVMRWLGCYTETSGNFVPQSLGGNRRAGQRQTSQPAACCYSRHSSMKNNVWAAPDDLETKVGSFEVPHKFPEWPPGSSSRGAPERWVRFTMSTDCQIHAVNKGVFFLLPSLPVPPPPHAGRGV